MEPFLQAQLQILNEENFSENNSKRFEDAMGLLKNNQKHNFSKYTFDGDYDKRTTSAYCFGIVFILFHELAHYLLGHLSKNEETLNDEECADDKVFWDIYMAEGLGEKEKFTANVGILLALFSLLFMNPKMKSDKIHPREDVRILKVYDTIKDGSSKYTTLVVSLFKDWAKKFEIKEFPNVSEKENDNALNEIRSFLSSKKEFD